MNKQVAEFFGFFETREVNREELQKFADIIRADEREACAKVCESHVRQPSRLHFAAAIRARGNT
jgi:hypothetical protein